jgi:hypothetical protein
MRYCAEVVDMRRNLTVVVLCGAVIVAAALYCADRAGATPSNSGFTTSYLVRGATFNAFEVFNQYPKDSLPAGNDDHVWLSLQKTIGRSDLYVVNNTWKPVNWDGTNKIASTGWHTHPGYTLIIVTAGTLTEYDADCTPHVHTAGDAASDTFVDPGRGHAHIIRNEGLVQASTTAVQLVPYDPAKANRRIDAPAPENCQSIN